MDVSINGPKVLFTLPFFGGIDVSQSVVSSWVVLALVTVFCLWLTHDMSVTNPSKRQIAAEKLVLMFFLFWILSATQKLILQNQRRIFLSLPLIPSNL